MVETILIGIIFVNAMLVIVIFIPIVLIVKSVVIT